MFLKNFNEIIQQINEMKLDPAKGPDTKNWSQCKIQSLIWLLEHITRDIRPKSGESENVSLSSPSIFGTFNFFP